MKKFALYMSDIDNYHLTKDVGLIPFIMQKYYGFDSCILIPENNKQYTDNDKYLENLKIIKFEDNNKLLNYLKEVDVLMVIGIYDFNISIINSYKYFNPNGKVYLKLDANLYWLNELNSSITEDTLNTLKKCDLITCESRKIQYFIKSHWDLSSDLMLNGYYEFVDDTFITYEEKENIILFVGRIGSYQKSIDILLNAFKNIESKIPNWKIELIGNMEEGFIRFIYNYFNENPHLMERAIITNYLDKKELKQKYKRSKVFCLTSIWEGCPNVFAEAISNGCYLITSDVTSAIEMIDYGNYGRIFPVKNTTELENELIRVCNDNKLLQNNCEASQIYSRNNLCWINLCGIINNKLAL
ncbi:glycosyltransferase family 4 protein [Romboutsia weinsteinii]|nr:glycosyltransferase family 4 protein [Romboutsia weinsteinii]